MLFVTHNINISYSITHFVTHDITFSVTLDITDSITHTITNTSPLNISNHRLNLKSILNFHNFSQLSSKFCPSYFFNTLCDILNWPQRFRSRLVEMIIRQSLGQLLIVAEFFNACCVSVWDEICDASKMRYDVGLTTSVMSYLKT